MNATDYMDMDEIESAAEQAEKKKLGAYMNEIELAKLFIERAETKKKLDALDEKITTAVLAAGESQKIGGTSAKYYGASFEVDYEGAAKHFHAPADVIEKYTKTSSTVSWKSVFEELGQDLPEDFKKEKPARVVIK